MILGVRGSGKTVLMTWLEKYFENLDDWIITDVNPEIDILEYFASSMYEKSNSKIMFKKKII